MWSRQALGSLWWSTTSLIWLVVEGVVVGKELNHKLLQLVEPVCDSGDRTPSIPVLLVSNDSGWDILHSLSAANLSLGPFTPPPTTFDPSAIVTLLIAVVTVVLGSYVANSPFKFLRYVCWGWGVQEL